MASERDPPWLDEAEHRAWMGYRRVRGLLDLQIARDLAADSGLSDADYDVLSTLSERAGHEWRLRDLAERLLWSRSRLAHHLARMERRDLVERRAKLGAESGAAIVMSRHGQEILEHAAPAHVRSVRGHFIDLLTTEQIEQLSGITDVVLAHLAAAGTDQATVGAPSSALR